MNAAAPMSVEERNAAVMANYGLVMLFAGPLAHRPKGGRPVDRDRDDLFQSGVIGLIDAVAKPRPADVALSTAAAKRVRTAAVRGACMNRGGVRIHSYLVPELAALRNTAARLERELGRPPEPREVADAMGLSGPRRRRLMGMMATFGHPDGLVSNSAGDALFAAAAEQRDVSEEAEKSDEVAYALAGVTERQAEYVRLHFGIGCEPRTTQEIADARGVSRTAVRSAIVRALATMRERLELSERGAA